MKDINLSYLFGQVHLHSGIPTRDLRTHASKNNIKKWYKALIQKKFIIFTKMGKKRFCEYRKYVAAHYGRVVVVS